MLYRTPRGLATITAALAHFPTEPTHGPKLSTAQGKRKAPKKKQGTKDQTKKKTNSHRPSICSNHHPMNSVLNNVSQG